MSSSAPVLRAEIRRLSLALLEWRCPACGGTGFYKGYSNGAPEGQACRVCRKTMGLHPTAHAALYPNPEETL